MKREATVPFLTFLSRQNLFFIVIQILPKTLPPFISAFLFGYTVIFMVPYIHCLPLKSYSPHPVRRMLLQMALQFSPCFYLTGRLFQHLLGFGFGNAHRSCKVRKVLKLTKHHHLWCTETFSVLTYIVIGKWRTQKYRHMVTLHSCIYGLKLLLISANDNELDVLFKRNKTAWSL